MLSEAGNVIEARKQASSKSSEFAFISHHATHVEQLFRLAR
jgi:hypothetical protein